MLLPTNKDLANALTTGQTLEVSFTLKFDWSRDGAYANLYSDLSENIDDVSLDAQFTGNYPAEYEVNDGYAQRRLTVNVSGSIAGVSAVKYFSPFGGYYGGSIGAVNTPCYFEVNVLTAAGVVPVRQFTGYLLEATPSRSENKVTLELADVTSQLTNPLFLAPYARSQALAQYSLGDQAFNDQVRQRGGTSLSWFLIDACRKCGLYQGPKPPQGTLAYFTCAGGVLPEVGTLTQMPRDFRQSYPVSDSGAWIMSARQQNLNELQRYRTRITSDFNYQVGPWSPDVNTPSKYPRYMWRKGPYGPEMLYDVYQYASYSSPDDVMEFAGTTSSPIRINPYGSTVDRLTIGGWIRLDKTISTDNETSMWVMLSGFSQYSEIAPPDPGVHNDVSGLQSSLRVAVNPSTQQTSVVLTYDDDNAKMHYRWSFSSRMLLTDDVHYIAAQVEFKPSGSPVLYLKTDDFFYSVSWDESSPNYPVGRAVYAQADGRDAETNGVVFSTSGGAQHWGAWLNPRQNSNAPRVWSNDAACMDYATATDISPSLARVMWSPSVTGKRAWDVIKEIGSADLGVVYTDEYGLLKYSNFDQVQAARNTANQVAALTLSEVQSLSPYTSFDSVANLVAYTSQDKYFIDTSIFKATDPQQFSVNPNSTARWQTTVDNVMSILPGRVTPRRLAQGYWSTTPGSGDNPNNVYTWQNFQTAYAPDKWKNGYESHSLGDMRRAPDGTSSAGQTQPNEGKGVQIFVNVGWAAGDVDPTHLTITMSADNSVSTTVYAAVDDNTAFLTIRGYAVEAADQVNTTVPSTNAASFASFGSRAMTRPSSEWASDYFTQHDLSQFLADDLATPKPVLESLEILGDPRRQLQDVMRIDDPGTDAIGGPIFASIVGINRVYSVSDGIKETLTLRTFGPRGGAWVLGDADFSQLGSTTILG